MNSLRSQPQNRAFFRLSLSAIGMAMVLLTPTLSRATGTLEEVKILAAAAKGDTKAQFKIGRDYAQGTNGLPRDEAEAARWYVMAAQQGEPHAENNLGMMYLRGTGVARDEKKAAEYLLKSAQQGTAFAQTTYASMLLNGNGVKRDPQGALGWYKKAAEQGLMVAQVQLGSILFFGDKVPRDYKQAAIWLERAAKQGDPDAQNMLGLMYEKGDGVSADLPSARQWFLAAAEQGNAKAQSNLGRLDASNGSENLLEAYKWLTLSSRQGEVTATNLLADFRQGLTQAQIDAGNKLVNAFVSSPWPQPKAPPL